MDTGRKRRLASGLQYLGSNSVERGMPIDTEYLNSIPSYSEVVAAGASAPKGCLNIDECFYDLDDCQMGSEVCFDTIGSFLCAPSTTTPAPPTIAPTACFMAQNECDADADCFADTFVPGGLFCKCRPGFKGDGTVKKDERGSKLRGCTDIDECSDKTHSCVPFEDEYCNNLYGTYECIKNIMCKGLTKCHPMATCQPVGESDYDCQCPEGYEGFGLGPKGCFDIDECGDETDKCHSTALCFNQMGSYQCRCPDNMGGILAGSVPNMEACDVPDTQNCGDITDHYVLHANVVHEGCKETKFGEECTFTCKNGTSTPSPGRITCDRKRKIFLDPPGTLIDCIPPADTKCGNLLEMPFATFLLEPQLAWSCSKGKESKKGYTEICEFKCPGFLSPTVLEPVEICDVKGKDEIATLKAGAISDFIGCVNANHYTDCGSVTDFFQLNNNGSGSDAHCEDNVCTFMCPVGYVPTIPQTKCLMTKHNGWFDNSGLVGCVPKPPDTPCGDIADTYKLQIDQTFTIQPDGLTVIFGCANDAKLPMPAYTECDSFVGVYEHEVGTQIRCV